MPINETILKEEIVLIGKKIEASKQELAKKLALNEGEAEEALQVRMELFQLIADAFSNGYDETITRIEEWGKEIGELAVHMEVELDESLKSTSDFRNTIWNKIEEISTNEGISLKTIFEVARIIDPLLDRVVYAYSTAYVEAYKSNIDKARESFLELSTPIVPILEGVAILPIIGDIDTYRASLLLEKSLEGATSMNLTHLFIDLSGVNIVDTMVANNIFKIIDSLKMIGVKGILAGIRPEVAMTMVSLGIEFKGVQTHSTLKQALAKHIL
ncbi:STAS domain-containing protein [Alkalihalobacillus sp. CinArs1]|uniref:STAS domain-containing protein n=1 Tax=Alkalihalobacillus sp. CinArs1 TaxID=2995314 RepID=UPI0022DCF16C|nr:STAS domain-containing protein [Alkalihalobacillus sp. CinArs1]